MTELGRRIWEKATQEGIKQGIEQERIRANQKLREVVRKMFLKGNNAEDISDCTGLPLEEVQRIEAEVLQQA